MKKVLIPTKLNKVAVTLLEQAGYDVVCDGDTPLAELISAHADTYALIVRSEKIPAEVMDKLPQLKLVVRAGAGFDNIDVKYARKHGIDVMNTPGANANGVAEEVIAMMLADARHIVAADTTTREGGWEKKHYLGREITGKTVGIIGLGNIGRLVAKRLRGFECRIMGYDPMLSVERIKDLNIEPADVATIFATCDYVTLHIPGGESTKGFVNATLLASMKPGATLINCARSGIVDEDALRAIKAEKNLRFLNDVYPKDEAGVKPVADIADLMLPHLGANTAEANLVAARRAAEELIDLDTKGITTFIVNRDIPEGLDRSYGQLAHNLGALVRKLAGATQPVKLIEAGVYGQLAPFADWLMVPMISGMFEDFDRFNDHKAIKPFLKEAGIELVKLDISEQNYENSIRIDLTCEMGANQLKRISIRGTVAEGTCMVSRIDEFDKLYFDPAGTTLFFIYKDRPGVTAVISRALARAGINIEDMRNPHHCQTTRSLAIVKVSSPVSTTLLEEIAESIFAESALCVTL